ncbi:para-aminobenzoate synthetase / 4-amino-4-deoxychorismate lyase [Virgibacillus subterraneus]|uniref:Para-aminobenzoate synthetase / 4-amino-4-deoxychorismate lyase n=1 Tax=Virgibacillus subterraneus TaxID=621109 RepID=A0A1H9L2C3_9BACI|nr:aminodeoxychorismate synthase component I [Virgibacillus subterraneus]SER05594.1 para-aminobenzoate synthetase / 4-amino-4-deoxychorismate lyase [Virgibacillus subterraneus]
MCRLTFDFTDHNGKKNPILFKDPLEIIDATCIEEVKPALKKIQEAIDSGFYAAGYLSYEAAPAFDNAYQVNSDSKMPLLWFGIFQDAIHEIESKKASYNVSEWKPTVGIEEYNSNIDRIKNHIKLGETYQVNYTIRMESEFEGDATAFYNHLASAQTSDYSAYMDIGDFSILSASPELFFKIRNGKITTKPMKGTIGRGKSYSEDLKNAEWLHQSEKNRAENVMIVDLLRNDLGMIAKPGSVKVPRLYSIEKYPTVYQMTSTVTAEIKDGTKILDIFNALFPCGSITGAPKVSTMKIISTLEPSPREVYCGTMGYITPNQEAIFNVPIRTVIIDNRDGSAQYGVGGGITWDSTKQGEYEEILQKTKLLTMDKCDFQLLETLGLIDGKYIVLDYHLERLENSAAYYNFQIDLAQVRKRLIKFAESLPKDEYRVRLLVSADGEISIESNVATVLDKPVYVKLAPNPINKQNEFLYHKTTNRTVYERFDKTGVFDVLLWNEEREITEFTIGNVVIELNDKLYTPPVDCGLLAGTYRKYLLEEGIIMERKILLEEIHLCSKVWLINSVRKWVEVRFE